MLNFIGMGLLNQKNHRATRWQTYVKVSPPSTDAIIVSTDIVARHDDLESRHENLKTTLYYHDGLRENQCP